MLFVWKLIGNWSVMYDLVELMICCYVLVIGRWNCRDVYVDCWVGVGLFICLLIWGGVWWIVKFLMSIVDCFCFNVNVVGMWIVRVWICLIFLCFGIDLDKFDYGCGEYIWLCFGIVWVYNLLRERRVSIFGIFRW